MPCFKLQQQFLPNARRSEDEKKCAGCLLYLDEVGSRVPPLLKVLLSVLLLDLQGEARAQNPLVGREQTLGLCGRQTLSRTGVTIQSTRDSVGFPMFGSRYDF